MSVVVNGYVVLHLRSGRQVMGRTRDFTEAEVVEETRKIGTAMTEGDIYVVAGDGGLAIVPGHSIEHATIKGAMEELTP